MDWYASPSGSASADGSKANPWDFHTAITKDQVIKPGDTIWVRGGRYTYANPWQFTVILTGTAESPIHIKPFPGERYVIDLGNNGTAMVMDNPARMLNPTTPVGRGAAYVWVWGAEITATGIPRTTNTPGSFGIGSIIDIEMHGVGLKLINCYIHDLHAGPGFWVESSGSEICGCIIGNVGWAAPDRGHGHCLYVQNDGSGVRKLIRENFLYSSFDIGMQWYGSGAALVQDILADGNVIVNAGAPIGQAVGQLVIAGGGTSKKGIVYRNGIIYVSPNLPGGFSQIGWGWDGDNADCDVEGNYFTRDIEFWHWQRVRLAGNTFEGRVEIATNEPTGETAAGYTLDLNQYAADVQYLLGSSHLDSAGAIQASVNSLSPEAWAAALKETNGLYRQPLPERSIVTPNPYQLGRANIKILNPTGKALMPADLSLVAGLANGDKWELRDGLNFNGPPVLSGVYSPSSPVISVPMAVRPVAPIEGFSNATPHTLPLFGHFVFLGGPAFDGSGGFTVPPPVPIIPPPPAPPVPTAPAIPQSGAPPNIVFSLSAPSIAIGESAYLEWSVTFALDAQAGTQSVVIAPLSGNQPRSGVKAVNPNGTTTYTLTAKDSKGLVTTAVVILAVGGTPTPVPVPVPIPVPVPTPPPTPAPMTIALTATPASLSAPGDVTISWSVQGAASVTLVGFGLQPASKSITRSLAAATDFTISATNSAGAVITKTITVAVGPAPTPVPVPVPVPAPIPVPPAVIQIGTLDANGKRYAIAATPLPDVPSSPFVKLDTATQGSWRGVYGAAGTLKADDTPSLPPWADIRPIPLVPLFTWAKPSVDIRALQSGAAGVAAAWFSTGPFSIDMSLTDGQTHQVAIYCVDWDSTTRRQLIEVLDDTGKVIDTLALSNFHDGVYVVWNLTGKFTIRVTPLVGNAVVSGIFFA